MNPSSYEIAKKKYFCDVTIRQDEAIPYDGYCHLTEVVQS
jgi:hypothetical protein